MRVFRAMCVVFAGIAVALVAGAQEHPEHPKAAARAHLTTDELAAAIEAYVDREAAKHDGFLVVHDPADHVDLRLKLAKVHRERLSEVNPQVYFACADFKATDGTVYDLDVFMEGPDKDSLTTTEVSVHKKDGVERYTWYEEAGYWKKLPKGKKGKSEHPEHPERAEHPEHPRNP
jgi:hypothetical protein